jgi:hypothetical protein
MYEAAISRFSASSETLFSAVSGLPADPGSDCCGPTTDASHHGADRAPRQRRDQGKRMVRDLLAPIYGWFTESFDTPVLKDARVLLDQLT